ncbi:hypothetical protein [Allomesorhizobium alhagi]|uniref:Uncharacterized protein n=1 Tax=Mesorhizobium alhagi CCNWXJ12-2 TaxID=1107882 RepID=H0HNK3_9HYPH|nr:hypothetical protein [Mesorhizobium alhagi]EHK57656.1 hypothetical protein MAXJ12_08629 [Mesorhizobium alhagi CCNWXJ12-2]
MDAIAEHAHRVSYHAVTRYVQRILGVEIACDDAMNPRAVAKAHCAAAGTTMEKVRADILTPAVLAAALAGLTNVNTPRMRLVIHAGIVATICSPRRKSNHRMQVRTDKEYRTRQSRFNRRMRHA